MNPIIVQSAMVLYTVSSVLQEQSVIKIFIQKVPEHTKGVKKFHTYGFWMTVILCIMMAFDSIPTAICSAIIYWIVFDCLTGKLIYKDWFYLGSEATTDRILKRLLGKRAGLIKTILCILSILALNILYL